MTLITSLYNTLGDHFAKHAAYTRTRREIANLPTELAIEDLGIFPSDADKIAAHTAEYEKNFANPFKAAERGYIDEVITPHSTRKRICRSFAMLRDKDLQNPWKKHGNLPL